MKTRLIRSTILAIMALVVTAPAASAGVVSLGDAGNFAVLSLEGGNLIINSATSIAGNVGYGKDVTSLTNQKVDLFHGAALVHGTADFNFTAKNYSPDGGILTGAGIDATLEQADADAKAASAAMASLTTTHTLGALGDDDDQTVNSLGEVNVISLASLNYNQDTLTLVSRDGFDDYFYFNVDGDFEFSASEIILDGTTPDHVVFNFPNASQITLNKAENIFLGTILAPLGGVDYHNPATFEGGIIALDINLHSDFNIANNGVVIPEPASLALIGLGTLCLGRRGRRRVPVN